MEVQHEAVYEEVLISYSQHKIVFEVWNMIHTIASLACEGKLCRQWANDPLTTTDLYYG